MQPAGCSGPSLSRTCGLADALAVGMGQREAPGPRIPAQEGRGHFLQWGGGDWTCRPGAGVAFTLWRALLRVPSPPPTKVWKSFQRPEWQSIHHSERVSYKCKNNGLAMLGLVMLGSLPVLHNEA